MTVTVIPGPVASTNRVYAFATIAMTETVGRLPEKMNIFMLAASKSFVSKSQWNFLYFN